MIGQGFLGGILLKGDLSLILRFLITDNSGVRCKLKCGVGADSVSGLC